jgi:transcriptional regulator with XRE-family HTH domain
MRPISGRCRQREWKSCACLLLKGGGSRILTQAQLAEKTGKGWHQSTIASIESGARKVDLLEFLKIAEALEFDPADFLRTLSTVRDD